MRDIDINSNLDQLKISGTISKSAKFKDILPWNISQMIMRTRNQHENSHKFCDKKKETTPFEFERKSKETETTT